MQLKTGYIFALFLIICFSAKANAVVFDTALLPLCLKLADAPEDENLHKVFTSHKTTQMMVSGLGRRGNVSFTQIAAQKARLVNYASMLPSMTQQLQELGQQATELVGEDALPQNFKIHVVCGAPADGFGFNVDGKLALFINLPLIPEDFFPSLVRHELWHVAFRAKYPKMAQIYETSASPLKRLGFIMLNEGVGHYYSFQRRVEPQMQYENWHERTHGIFSLLDSKTKELLASHNRKEEEDLLWSSEAGVPFWQKWGALPGAIMTYRMKKEISTSSLKAIIADGPCAFLSSYQQMTTKMPEWNSIPPSLVDANCALD